MKKNLFEIPIFKISCSNWKQKKKKLDPIINKHKLSRKNFNTFYTSKGGCLTGRGINDNFADNFKDIWVVAYEQHDYQVPHQHGPLHWSGILYHDYVPEQPATVFIQPWHSFATHGYTNLKSLETKEGDIVFFPSFLLHFCPTNPLKKIRKVVSWDLECE